MDSKTLFNVLELYKAAYLDWEDRNSFISKSDGSLVSGFEKDVEYKIGKYLKEITPWASFEGEEGYKHITNNQEKYKWYIDPIDGTISFKNGLTTFGLTLTLVKDLEPLVTLIFFPKLNETYTAYKGYGAFLNGKKITINSYNSKDKHKIIARSDSYVFRNYNSKQALEKIEQLPFYIRTYTDIHAYSLVATGKIAAKIDAAAALWDLFPGILLIKEAGGVYYFYPAENSSNDHYGSLILGHKSVVEELHEKLHGKDVKVYRSKIPYLKGLDI